MINKLLGVNKSSIPTLKNLSQEDKDFINFIQINLASYKKCKKMVRDKYAKNDSILCMANVSPNCKKEMPLNKRFAWSVHAEVHTLNESIYLNENNLFPICYSCHLMMYEKYQSVGKIVYYIRDKGYAMRKNITKNKI